MAKANLFLLTILSSSTGWAFQFSPTLRSSSVALGVHTLRDADLMEMMAGGERYEMVPLPDSMVDTTLFVGNLNEFAKDEDLSDFFKTVSTLQSVPACVARKANMASMEYGFVSFPNVEEKEAAIMRFHGSSFMGRTIKVEPIRDHPKKGRVRVPERMVSYVSGAAKKTRDGRANSMRRIARLEKPKEKKQQQKNRKKVDRRSERKRVEFKLSDPDQEELLRASRRGYVTLDGTGYRRGRKTSTLACAHRQWSDEREKPQIVLCKASGGRPLDCVIVDLSPLRMKSAVGADLVDEFLVKWKAQIITAAANSDMELRSDYLEDNCETLTNLEDEEECGLIEPDEEMLEYVVELTDEDSWATASIANLPVVSMGVFEGERSKAKAMARELALLWDIPEEPVIPESSNSQNSRKGNWKGKKQRRNKKDENRRRRRNDARDLNFFML